MIDKNRVAICKNCNNTLEWDNLENEWTHIDGSLQCLLFANPDKYFCPECIKINNILWNCNLKLDHIGNHKVTVYQEEIEW